MVKYYSTEHIHANLVYEFGKEWRYLIEKKAQYDYYRKVKEWECAEYQWDCMQLAYEKLDTIIEIWGATSNQMMHFSYFLWLCVDTIVHPETKAKGDLRKTHTLSFKGWRKQWN